MTNRIEIAGLRVAGELFTFVADEALPGTGIGEIDFEAIAARDRPQWEIDDELTFTMPEAKPRKAAPKRKAKPQDLELPFDDIPF